MNKIRVGFSSENCDRQSETDVATVNRLVQGATGMCYLGLWASFGVNECDSYVRTFQDRAIIGI